MNAGFVVGDAETLIVDTGANTLAAGTIHGYASTARPGNTLRGINTEKHFDHIGGNGFFRDRGIDVWGHSGIARTEAEFQSEIDEFNAAIPNRARRDLGEAHVFFHGTRLQNPNRVVYEDTLFVLGGCRAEILLTPGHTPANLSVWVPEDRVLFTGDCLIVKYAPNLDSGSTADWTVWLDSIDRIERLNPAIVVAGHGPVATGDEVHVVIDTVRRVLREAIARAEESR